MPREPQPCIESTPISLDKFRTAIRSNPGSVFAVVDACDAPLVPVKVAEIGEARSASLYRGSAEREHWAIAPYLMVVDGEILNWIVKNYWENAWGFFLVAPNTTLKKMRSHLHQFLTVEIPDGKTVYFRFYDPRVLSTFLRTCDRTQLQDFFGIATSLLITDSEDGELLQFKRTCV